MPERDLHNQTPHKTARGSKYIGSIRAGRWLLCVILHKLAVFIKVHRHHVVAGEAHHLF